MHPRLARIGFAAAVAAVLSQPLHAQKPATPAPSGSPAAPKASAQSTTPTASQTAAAHELFKAIRLQESIAGTSAAMVDSEISHNPGLGPYRDVMLGWLQKYMTWDAMLPELTRIYAEA